MKQKGVVGIDILRIVSGFFVVLIHVTDQFILFEQYVGGLSWVIIFFSNIFARVAVPLFILISGYLLLRPEKIVSYKEFYRRRLGRLGVPTLFWTTFFFVWQAYWMGIPVGISYILNTLYAVTIGPLYFLIVILQLYLFAPFLLRAIQSTGMVKKAVFATFLMLISVGINFIPQVFFDSTYHTSTSILTISIPYIFYFFVGGMLHRVKLRPFAAILLFSLYIFFGFLAFILSINGGGNSILSYSSPVIILMSLSLFLAVMPLEGVFIRMNEFFKKWVHVLAGATFGIYLIHVFIIDILSRYTTLKPGYVLSPIWGNAFLIVILVYVASFIFVGIIRKFSVGRHVFGEN